MTIVTLPYSYRVEGILAGDKSVKLHRVIDSILVDVPEVSFSEAPIGFSFGRDEQDGEMEMFRSSDGRPVQPMARPSDERYDMPKGAMTLEELDSAAARVLSQERPVFWHGYPLVLPVKEHLGEVERSAPLHGRAKFKSVVRNHREHDRAEAEAFAAGMLSVDGAVHAVVPEPRWVVSIENYGRHPNVRVRLSSNRNSGGEVFRVDRKEDALAFAESIRGEKARVVVESKCEDAGLIQWHYDDAHESAVNAAGNAMLVLGGAKASQLRFMDQSFYEPMCELRRLWRSEGPTPAIVLQLRTLRVALAECTDPWCKELVGLVQDALEVPLVRHNDFERAIAVEAPDLDGFSMVPR